MEARRLEVKILGCGMLALLNIDITVIPSADSTKRLVYSSRIAITRVNCGGVLLVIDLQLASMLIRTRWKGHICC